MKIREAKGSITLIELLIIVAIIGIISAIALPGLMRAARVKSNEQETVASLRIIKEAQKIYAKGCGGQYAVSLEDLASVTPDLISDDMVMMVSSSSEIRGYIITISGGSEKSLTPMCNDAQRMTSSDFVVTAQPARPGESGYKYFAVSRANVRVSSRSLLDAVSGGVPLENE